MWSIHVRHTAFGAIGEISTFEKEGWLGQDKSDGRPWTFSVGREMSFKCCHGPYIDTDIDLQQLWGKTVALVREFHTSRALPYNWRALYVFVQPLWFPLYWNKHPLNPVRAEIFAGNVKMHLQFI